MAKTTVIIKRPDEQYGHVTNISTKLENLQKIVEGPIEIFPMVSNGAFVCICNEEGKLRGLPVNMPFKGDWLVGTIIIAGAVGDELADIPFLFDDWKRL